MAVSVKSRSRRGILGRIIGTLFFSVFAAAGVFFFWMIARDVYRNLQAYSWSQIECVVLDSKIIEREGEKPYEFDVRFQYAWQGKDYVSRSVSLEKLVFSDYTEPQRLLEKYRPDSKSKCYVNPSNPTDAVLQRKSLFSALAIFFPLIFVLIGFGGMWGMWYGLRKPKTEEPTPPKPVTEKVTSRIGGVVMVGFFGVFFLVGSLAGWGMGIKPLLRIVVAKSWVGTPCTILSSRVISHSSDDGTTYKIHILYSYQFNGRDYKSSRYHFIPGSSSGYKAKAAIVANYRPGMRTTCYVNPQDPVEAVIQRKFSSSMWFGILFPIPFFAVGAGGLGFLFYKWRKSRLAQMNAKWGDDEVRFPLKREKLESKRPAVLNPMWSRVGALFVAILVAAFWNGIVSIFVWQAIQSWKQHRPEWFLTIFLIPFVVIGFVIIGYVVSRFFALFNPIVELTLDSQALELGKTLTVRWRLKGQVGRLRNLRIYLEGREEVTYTRGTATATDKSVFATYDLANVTQEGAMRAGSAQIHIPEDTMHSFAGQHNKIVWAIHVHGEIPHWPDIKEEHRVEIAPMSVASTNLI